MVNCLSFGPIVVPGTLSFISLLVPARIILTLCLMGIYDIEQPPKTRGV